MALCGGVFVCLSASASAAGVSGAVGAVPVLSLSRTLSVGAVSVGDGVVSVGVVPPDFAGVSYRLRGVVMVGCSDGDYDGDGNCGRAGGDNW